MAKQNIFDLPDCNRAIDRAFYDDMSCIEVEFATHSEMGSFVFGIQLKKNTFRDEKGKVTHCSMIIKAEPNKGCPSFIDASMSFDFEEVFDEGDGDITAYLTSMEIGSDLGVKDYIYQVDVALTELTKWLDDNYGIHLMQ